MVLTSLKEFNRERKEGVKAGKNAIARISFSFFFFLARSSCFHSPQTPVPQAIGPDTQRVLSEARQQKVDVFRYRAVVLLKC